MAKTSPHQAALKTLRRERDAARDQLLAARLAADLAESAARGRGATAKSTDRQMQEAVTAAKTLVQDKDVQIKDRLARAVAVGPQQLVEDCDGRTPFLLLPVRIETRFWTVGQRYELRVRIFPDEIAVTTHEKRLSASEVKAGHDFWTERSRAATLADVAEKQRAEQGAWTLLVYRHGEHRATWIARSTRPVNWEPTRPPSPDALQFADPGLVRPDGLAGLSKSLVMPDCFVVRLIAGGHALPDVVGRPIPDDLVLGPDPLQLEAMLSRDATTGKLTASPNLAWLFDFDAAEAVGLAVRIPLDAATAQKGIERVIVLGLKLTSDAQDCAALLERLIEGHRFTRGFDLVPNGTPTNNTESAPSGFTSDLAEGVDSLGAAVQEDVAVSVTDHAAKPDAQRLAEALGIDFASVTTLGQAKRRDIGEALAINRALWPATLGGYARTFVSPLMDDGQRQALERFFLTFVTGRGLIPPIRAGRQPYSVLPTSVFDRWTWAAAEVGQERGFLERLHSVLADLTAVWRALAPNVARIKENDPDHQAFMATVGLQPASVTYASRKAVTDLAAWNALLFGPGRPRRAVRRWWSYVNRRKSANLAKLEFDPTREDLKIKDLTFLQVPEILDGPVVDADPTVPLSENVEITPFDGSRNYVDWLLTADWGDIENERFRKADGEPIPAPRALLYQYLRHAQLDELRRASASLLARMRPAIFVGVDPDPDIVNIGTATTLTHSHLLNVDAQRIGVSSMSQPIGNYLLDRARRPGVGGPPPLEVLDLSTHAQALTELARVKTARLERLFAEHIDTCCYRLDAWHMGLFLRRLDFMRRSEGGSRGIYVGAYGFVENLQPNSARPQIVDPSKLHNRLREPGQPVIERADNAGYVHAPSLTQAVTASVLLNAYLSHAKPGVPNAMAINLTSERVRRAMGYIEGIRNGQELAALLGYQLERGLHEGYPGIELDQYIYLLRERFPFTSRKLTPVPDGHSAEVIEARNVVNGSDLLEFTRDKIYPYGIAGLPAARSTAGEAIAAEISRLADSMDAVADLLNAESVQQVAQGNYDRARAVIQSLGEGELPPIPDVVQTPRSGRAITQRAVILLSGGVPWTGSPPLAPRAAANPRLNSWLASLLPRPDRIAVSFARGGMPTEPLTLAETGLDAIDTVLMSGETLGDNTSELERFLVDHYRATRTVDDSVRLFFRTKTDPAVPDAQSLVLHPGEAPTGSFALEPLLPLLKRLRSLATTSRPVNAGDFRLASRQASADPANPKGFDGPGPPLQDMQELGDRVATAINALDQQIEDLTITLDGSASAFETLESDASSFEDSAWSGPLAAIRSRLRALSKFGLPEALPASAHGTTLEAVRALIVQARAVLRMVTKRSSDAKLHATPAGAPSAILAGEAAARAKAQAIEARVNGLGRAMQSIFGKAMLAVPLFGFDGEQQSELAAAFSTPVTSDILALETWLQSLSRVREPISKLAWIMSYCEWTSGTPARLTPLQLPRRSGDPWVGGTIGRAELPDEVLSIVSLGVPSDVAAPQAGLMIDDWTEIVPVDKETTGIAFHFNRPNAAPPQALLLAVPPVLKGHWSWNDLVDSVADTLDRAKLRAVEPDHLLRHEHFQVLPATLLPFSAGGSFLSTLLALNASRVTASTVP